METQPIPFNKVYLTGKEHEYVNQALDSGRLSGNNHFSKACSSLIETKYGVGTNLLTPSCTDALEMTAILLNIKPGDEVILPSYTFTSTANAFCLFGAKPVFVEVDPETLTIDPEKVAEKITTRTRAVVPVIYAGVSADMDELKRVLAPHKNITLVEDAAQGVGAKYKNNWCGSQADLSCYSFHETKNCTSGGEGGALLINEPSFIERAEWVQEKGTNRTQMLKGLADKYNWVSLGSSFLPTELQAAFLLAQLESIDSINHKRVSICDHYREALTPSAEKEIFRFQRIPDDANSNGHAFCLLWRSQDSRDKYIDWMKSHNVSTYTHYVPLHDSPIGTQYGYKRSDLPITSKVSDTLVRLPVFAGLSVQECERVVDLTNEFTKNL